MIRAFILLAVAVLLGSCNRSTRSGPVRVGIIQQDANSGSPIDLAIRAAAGRGLVRLDASGQIVPDLAARWAIGEDGLDYIFRVEDGVAPKLVARRLRGMLADRANPLRFWLEPVARIEAVTATVVEIRLSSPMPDLLPLLARPEMALAELSGPMRAIPSGRDRATLVSRLSETEPERIAMTGESAGRAVARFAAGRADVVLGGTFIDLPVASAAALPAGALVRDPARGLFGFARRTAIGPVRDRTVMRALGQAIDRDRIAALIGGRETEKATTVAGSTLEPPLSERVAAARRALSAPLAIRVALPEGPGARLLFALVAQDWQRIGVSARAVPADATADLALIDIVVPPGEVTRIACVVSAGCDPRDPSALLDPTFIPLTQPVRWSLIARGIGGFAENPLAAHPIQAFHRAR